MYRVAKNLFFWTVISAFALILSLGSVFLIGPLQKIYGGVLFGLIFLLSGYIMALVINSGRHWMEKVFKGHAYNQYLYQVLERLRLSFSVSDFTHLIQTVLEDEANFTIAWLRSHNGNIVYLSENRRLKNREMKTVFSRFADNAPGLWFLDGNSEMTNQYSLAKGVMINNSHSMLFLFSCFIPVFDRYIFEDIHREFELYLNRVDMIEKLFQLSSVSKEWMLLAETQKSFLPLELPVIHNVDISIHYQALVNVSGDYYQVIKIDQNRSLIILGDVSGKGLSAALIMGIILNTISIVQDKSDLLSLINYIDYAIKNMDFPGKFTAVLLGLIDTDDHSMTYINAGIPEPCLISKSGLHFLKSNCPLVGIIDLNEFHADKVLFSSNDVLVICSDGVTEVENEERVQLSDTLIYREVLQNSIHKSADETRDDIINLVNTYGKSETLRDDVTLLVAKMRG